MSIDRSFIYQENQILRREIERVRRQKDIFFSNIAKPVKSDALGAAYQEVKIEKMYQVGEIR